jgi:hypothetical protein
LNSTARMALLPTLGSDARADSKADCDWADGLGLFIVCRDRVRERESPADRQTARSWLHCLCTASALGQATQAGRQAGRPCHHRGAITVAAAAAATACEQRADADPACVDETAAAAVGWLAGSLVLGHRLWAGSMVGVWCGLCLRAYQLDTGYAPTLSTPAPASNGRCSTLGLVLWCSNGGARKASYPYAQVCFTVGSAARTPKEAAMPLCPDVCAEYRREPAGVPCAAARR